MQKQESKFAGLYSPCPFCVSLLFGTSSDASHGGFSALSCGEELSLCSWQSVRRQIHRSNIWSQLASGNYLFRITCNYFTCLNLMLTHYASLLNLPGHLNEVVLLCHMSNYQTISQSVRNV